MSTITANPITPSWTVQRVPESELEPWTLVQYKAFVGAGNRFHAVIYPPFPDYTQDDMVGSVTRHRAALEAEPEYTHFVQIVDKATGEIAGGAKWFFYPTDAGRPERLLVGEWAGVGKQK
ncbi:hypothetical protein LTR66_013359, partial [Elasticomyces elasticus]